MHAAGYISPYAALVRERLARHAEARRLGVLFVALLVIFGLCLVYLNLRSQVARRSYEVRALAAQKGEISRQVADLKYEIARETAPQRIAEWALSQRLVPITRTHTVLVPGLSSKLEAGQAAGATTMPTATRNLAAEGQATGLAGLWEYLATRLNPGTR